MTVADLLKQSMSFHNRAAMFRRERNTRLATEALTKARELRLEAVEADPQKDDPAWQSERVPHDELMAFYFEQLGGTR